MKRLLLLGTACGLGLLLAVPAQAQLNGSHTLGDFGVQSGSQPQPGFYAALFYLRYDTDTIKDANGRYRPPLPSSPGSLAVSAVAPTGVVREQDQASGGELWRDGGAPVCERVDRSAGVRRSATPWIRAFPTC